MGYRAFFFLAFVSHAAFAAQPAARPYDAENYRITLQLDPATDPTEFQAEMDLSLKATAPLTEIALDREELRILQASEMPGNKPLPVDTKDPALFKIRLSKPLAKGKSFTLRVRYTGKIRVENRGFFKVTDPDEPERGPLLFTTFEPGAARTFFPCNDRPNDKATTELVVTVPATHEALSNGRLVANQVSKEGDREWKTVHWKMEKPHSTYLVSLAVAPFAKVSADHRGKEISVWVGATKKEKAEFALQTTKSSMAFFENYLGVNYPWPKYATVGLPTFIWGGMENTSSTHMNQNRTTLNDPRSEWQKMAITQLAAHELAHQWFGDYATLNWWDDLWLNESFANFLDAKAVNHFFKNEESTIHTTLETWDKYFRQENGPRSHPVVDKKQESPEESFDTISYTKGENVLRMLEFYVGKEKMRAGLKKYLEKYAYSNATYLDFFKVIADTAKINLDAFRDSWLLQRGYPVISYAGKWSPEKKRYAFRLQQKSNHAEDKSLFVFRIPVSFHRKTSPAFSKTLVLDVSRTDANLEAELPAAPEWVSVNAGSVVLGKIQQEKRDESDLQMQALQDPDALTRIRAAYDLAAPLLENTGPLSPSAEGTLTAFLKQDPEASVRLALLQGLQLMKSRWLTPALAQTVLDLCKNAGAPPAGFSQRDERLWRAALLETLGKVQSKEALPILTAALHSSETPLDEVSASARAIASQGAVDSTTILKKGLQVQSNRGYSYRYVVELAFGGLESADAAAELQTILGQANAELAGKLGGLIVHNQALRTSAEWALVLKDFVLKNETQGDEVKSRLLQTIEEVKTKSVKGLVLAVAKDSSSPRLKGLAQKILDKNFSGSH